MVWRLYACFYGKDYSEYTFYFLLLILFVSCSLNSIEFVTRKHNTMKKDLELQDTVQFSVQACREAKEVYYRVGSICGYARGRMFSYSFVVPCGNVL